mmetsp:Transcript_22660/g.51063  ORF Transcript_22660/g.51063 Transcript_22660/m.51063 type:complete len:1524 (-) Transcript_22660:53-4624(-)
MRGSDLACLRACHILLALLLQALLLPAKALDIDFTPSRQIASASVRISGPLLLTLQWTQPQKLDELEFYLITLEFLDSFQDTVEYQYQVSKNLTSVRVSGSEFVPVTTIQPLDKFREEVNYTFIINGVYTGQVWGEVKYFEPNPIQALDVPHAPENVSLTWSSPFNLVVHFQLPPDSELSRVPQVVYDIEWYAVETVGNETQTVSILNDSFVDDGSGQRAYEFADLKGSLMIARLRVAKNVTLVSPGLWSNFTNALYVIDVPSSVDFEVNSGRAGTPYLAVRLHVPLDTGNGVSTNIPILEYDVQVSTEQNFSETATPSHDAAMLYWTFADLQPGTMYYIRSRARNPAGYGNYSFSSYRLLVPPSAPDLMMQYQVPLAVNFSWQPPADLGYGEGVPISQLVAQNFFYQIYISNQPFSPSSIAGLRNLSGGLQNNSWYVPDASKGEILHFAVRGKNLAEQYGTWSIQLNVTVIDLPATPSSPSLVLEGDRAVRVSWNSPSDSGAGTLNDENFITKFELEFLQNGSLSSAEAYQTSFLREGLLAGVPLRVKVRAVNPVGAGNFSFLSDPITPMRLPSSPQIRNVTVLKDEGSSLVVAVNFSAPEDAGLDGIPVSLSYFILVTSDMQGCDNVTGEAAEGATSFLLPSMSKACTYTFRVRARNPAGFSSYSDPVSKLLIGLASPPRVQQANLLGGLQDNSFSWSFSVSWSLPEDTGGGMPSPEYIEYYLVEISQDPTFAQLVSQQEVSNPTFSATYSSQQLQTRLPLLFRISAMNLFGLGLPAVNSTGLVLVLPVNASVAFFDPSDQPVEQATAGSLVGCEVQLALPTQVTQFDALAVKFVDFDLSYVGALNDTIEILEAGVSSSSSSSFKLSWSSLRADQVQLNFSAPVSVSAGAELRFSLRNLTCRHWSGRTSFEIRVVSSSGLIAEAYNVPAILLLPGSLSANISILDQLVQASALVQLMPSMENSIPARCVLNLTVSPQFVVEDYLSVQRNDFLGEFTVQVEGRSIVVTRVGQEVRYGELVSFSLLGLKSVANMSVIESFALQTRREEGEVIDSIDSLVPSYSFSPASPGNLSCPVGTYLERLGCTNCPGNSSSPAGSTSVLNCSCDPGYTGVITSKSSSCSPCPAGTSKPLPGNSSCLPCGFENYSPRTGQAICPPNVDLRACDNQACKFQLLSKDSSLWTPDIWLSLGAPAPGKLIPDSDLYFSLPGQNRILRVDRQSGTILLDAGCTNGRLPSDVAVAATAACFNVPTAMVKVGNSLIIADTMNFALRQLDLSSSSVSTVAVGTPGFPGTSDGDQSTARLELPIGLAGSSSTLYLLDKNRVRVVNTDTGDVSTLAGSGANGFVDGVGTAAEFHSPRDILQDGDKLYVAESGSHRIRMLSASTGEVSTLAGYAWKAGTQDGTGTFARFLAPFSLALASTTKELFVADYDARNIRVVDLASRAVRTLVSTPYPATSIALTESATAVNMLYIAYQARVDRLLFICAPGYYREGNTKCYVCAPSCESGKTFVPLCDGVDDNICE